MPTTLILSNNLVYDSTTTFVSKNIAVNDIVPTVDFSYNIVQTSFNNNNFSDNFRKLYTYNNNITINKINQSLTTKNQLFKVNAIPNLPIGGVSNIFDDYMTKFIDDIRNEIGDQNHHEIGDIIYLTINIKFIGTGPAVAHAPSIPLTIQYNIITV
jgi:hypothetical protein